MAFVNEYISDEDMEKYKIIDMYKSSTLNWNHVDEGLMKGHYAWTINKERNIYLIPMAHGRFEESNQRYFVLWWKGVLLGATVASVGGGVNHIERTGSEVWDLLRLRKPENFLVPDAEIIPVLKEALVVFQYNGIHSPMHDYKVTFTF
jgi:hypothetical protein